MSREKLSWFCIASAWLPTMAALATSTLLLRGQGAQDQRAHQPRRLAALAGDQAGNVALRYVAEFVRQHAGQFLRALGDRQQPQVHPHVTARQGKCVHGLGAVDHQLPGQALIQLRRHIAALARRAEQWPPDRLQVVHQHRIVQVIGVAVDLARDLVTQPALVGDGEFGAIAQTGQAATGQGARWQLAIIATGLHLGMRQRHRLQGQQRGQGHGAQRGPQTPEEGETGIGNGREMHARMMPPKPTSFCKAPAKTP